MKPTTSPAAVAATVQPKDTQAGVFVSTLSAMQNGRVLDDLDDAIRECTRAVSAAGKKGKVTLSLTITPNGVGAGETPLFKVEDDITVKSPKPSRLPSVFFADEDCNLTRRNHRQEEIRFQSVDGAKGVDVADIKSQSAQA